MIKIAGLNYNLEFVSSENMGGNIGLADFNKQLITINENCTDQTKHIAVLHEILHILDRVYNLKLSEEQVIYTTHALIALFEDNPHMFKCNFGVE
jgi:hypothetical protein